VSRPAVAVSRVSLLAGLLLYIPLRAIDLLLWLADAGGWCRDYNIGCVYIYALYLSIFPAFVCSIMFIIRGFRQIGVARTRLIVGVGIATVILLSTWINFMGIDSYRKPEAVFVIYVGTFICYYWLFHHIWRRKRDARVLEKSGKEG
jgi:hypothetical protein